MQLWDSRCHCVGSELWRTLKLLTNVWFLCLWSDTLSRFVLLPFCCWDKWMNWHLSCNWWFCGGCFTQSSDIRQRAAELSSLLQMWFIPPDVIPAAECIKAGAESTVCHQREQTSPHCLRLSCYGGQHPLCCTVRLWDPRFLPSVCVCVCVCLDCCFPACFVSLCCFSDVSVVFVEKTRISGEQLPGRVCVWGAAVKSSEIYQKMNELFTTFM